MTIRERVPPREKKDVMPNEAAKRKSTVARGAQSGGQDGLSSGLTLALRLAQPSSEEIAKPGAGEKRVGTDSVESARKNDKDLVLSRLSPKTKERFQKKFGKDISDATPKEIWEFTSKAV